MKIFKKIFKKRIKEIHQKFVRKEVLIFDDMSNFFGQESLGVWKVRGNGLLILTDEELYFGMWKPQKEFSIPINSIIEITNPKSHMNKYILKPLLKVIFRNKEGESDSAAWYVSNLERWNKLMTERIKRKHNI
ncbi:MAG: hypothetical protein ACFE8N_10325 [Promethearchaeota archaeon]